MQKIFLAGTVLVSTVFLASAGQAADVAPAVYDWSGVYVGVNAGAGFNNTTVDNTSALNTSYSLVSIDNEIENKLDSNQSAFTGGALIGYNMQMDQIVLGVETDFNYLGFSDEEERKLSQTASLVTGDAKSSVNFDANWFGTLRGRIGFAADNMLFYGTGGLAYGHMDASADAEVKLSGLLDGKYNVEGSNSSTNWGWTAGAGMEYGIDKWSLGVEYLYVDLGSAEWNNSRTVADIHSSGSVEGSVDYAFSVVRATAKLRF